MPILVTRHKAATKESKAIGWVLAEWEDGRGRGRQILDSSVGGRWPLAGQRPIEQEPRSWRCAGTESRLSHSHMAEHEGAYL